MFAIEMFILTHGMLNSAKEVQERKWEKKGENYTFSRYSEKDQKTNFTVKEQI